MFDPSDPRSSLTITSQDRVQSEGPFSHADYVRFYEEPAQEEGRNGKTWYARGQNFVMAISEAKAGMCLARLGQPDESVLIIPDSQTLVEVEIKDKISSISGESIAFLPPGDSSLKVIAPGRVIRLFTNKATDLIAKSINRNSYTADNVYVRPFEPWPEPYDGYKLRIYSLNVAPEAGRFGRIWRSTNFMINFLDIYHGPRDATKLSPHFHDDFEQCSLALEGEFIHHLRWPWTVNKNHWRPDDHELCKSPSIAIIPPPAIHTTEAIGTGINRLVDIFCPPRLDFSQKSGWVLNSNDYPLAES